MPFDVGLFSYINSLPLWGAYKLEAVAHPFSITYGTPSQLNKKFEQGQLSVSMVSSMSYWKMGHDASPFLSFGIAAGENVKSVLLFTRLPVHDLSGKTIWLTGDSETSIALLQVLCHHMWRVEPLWKKFATTPPDDADAYLLIGDQGLTHSPPAGYLVIDLAEAWHSATGLPFIFGLFVVKNMVLETRQHELELVAESLHASYSWGLEHPEKMMTLAQKVSRLPQPILADYFRTIQIELTDKHREGFALFTKLYQECDQHALCC